MCQSLLESDQSFGTLLDFSISAQSDLLVLRLKLVEKLGEEPDLVVSDLCYGRVHEIPRQTVNRVSEVSRTLTNRIDVVVLNRILAIPVFLFTMYLTFMLTINLGGAFIDFIDQFNGAITVDGFRVVLEAPRSTSVADHTAGRRSGGRDLDHRDLHPPDFLFVSLPFPPRRFGLHGVSSLHHGPADTRGGTSGQGNDPDDGRVWLQRACSDGDPNSGRPSRTNADGDDGADDVLWSKASCLRTLCRGFLSGSDSECGFRSLPDWHPDGGVYRISALEDLASGRKRFFCHRTTNLPCTNFEGDPDPYFGTPEKLLDQSRQDHLGGCGGSQFS